MSIVKYMKCRETLPKDSELWSIIEK